MEAEIVALAHWLVPPSNTVTGLRGHGLDAQRFTEDLLGEVDERKTRISTTVKCPTTLEDIDQILAGLANLQGLVKVWVTVPDGEKGPFLYWAARDLMTLLTSLDFRRAYAQQFPAKQPHLLHYLMAVIDRILHTLALWSQRFSNLRLAANGKWGDLNTSALQQAEEAYIIDRQRIATFCAGDTVPIVQTWTESKEEKALKERQEAANFAKFLQMQGGGGGRKRNNNRPGLGESEEKRRQTTLGEAATRSKSKAGDIIYKGKGLRMPLPKMPEGAKKPCAAHYRQGSYCRFGHGCDFDHTPIDELEPACQKAWISLVRKTEGMSFNLERVKCGVAAVNRAVSERKSSDAGETTAESKKPAAT